MNELLATLFLSREYTHREHLNTSSYATHMALGSFYTEIIDLADSLAEMYQGYVGKRIGDIPYYGNPAKGDVVGVMTKLLEQIQTERKDCCTDSTAIQNTIDEVEALFMSTIYKLKFLS